jgi:hypothetical protein
MTTEFDVLVERYIDGVLTDEERVLLDRQCSDDPVLKERLLEAMYMEYAARARGQEQAVVIPLRPRRRLLPLGLAAAAAVLFLVISFLLKPVVPDVDRSIAWGGERQDLFGAVVVREDRVLIGGGSYSFGPADHSGLLVALDRDRKVSWQKSIGLTGTTAIRAMASLPSGDVILAGVTSEGSVGNFDQWTARMTVDGDLVWQKSLGSSRAEAVSDAVVLDGEIVVLVGTTSADLARGPEGFEVAGPLPTAGYNALTLTALTAEGDVLWQRIVDPSRSLEGPARRLMVLQPRAVVAGGELWIVGNTDRNGSISTWLARFDLEGGLTESWEISAGAIERGSDLEVLPDGRVVVLGGSVDPASGMQRLRWYVVDPSDRTVVGREWSSGEATMGHLLSRDGSGGLWAVGQIRPGQPDADVLVLRLNASADPIEAWRLDGEGVQRVYDLSLDRKRLLVGVTGPISSTDGLLLEWTGESRHLSRVSPEFTSVAVTLRPVEIGEAPADLVPAEANLRMEPIPGDHLRR